MPFVLQLIASDFLLDLKRYAYRFLRFVKKERPKADVFIAIDDPYSFLLLQSLPMLSAKYDIDFRINVVVSLDPLMFPELEKWQDYAQRDCVLLAKHYHLEELAFSNKTPEALAKVISELLSLIRNNASFEQMLSLLQGFYSRPTVEKTPIMKVTSGVESILALLSPSEIQQVKESEQKLKHMGHYLPATIYFEGEWYWGVDRLHFLDERLSTDSRIQPKHSKPVLAAPTFSLERTNHRFKHPIVFYYSARSPYSYLGLEQVVKLASHYKIELIVKPVLPMVMRGLAVPNTKKIYIFKDTKREAKRLHIPYGKVADPLGKAVENCYALFQFAKDEGKEIEFLIAFGRAVNANGVRGDTVKGMKQIAENAGINWPDVNAKLKDRRWQEQEKQNRAELEALGLWGVPCFQYNKHTYWGQDRLCLLEQAVLKDRTAYVS